MTAPKYSVGLNNSFFSSRNVPTNYQDDVPESSKNLNNANGFMKTDLSIIAKPFEKVILNAKINNVFNSKFYSPPFGGSDGYDFEWPGMNFRIAAIYRFN